MQFCIFYLILLCLYFIELAKAHKDDGNEQFKYKRYKLAVTAYSEGLKMKCEDNELNKVLYTNRAAAYYHMGMFNIGFHLKNKLDSYVVTLTTILLIEIGYLIQKYFIGKCL